MKVDENIIKRIIGDILKVSNPEKVILFGSAATGAMSHDSDLDLIVVEKRVDDPRERIISIRSALGSFGVPIDVIVIASERFEETKDVIGGIAYPANKYGKVIYEAGSRKAHDLIDRPFRSPPRIGSQRSDGTDGITGACQG